MTTLKDLIRLLFGITPAAVPEPALTDDYFDLDQIMNRIDGPPDTRKPRKPRKPARLPVGPDGHVPISYSIRRVGPEPEPYVSSTATMKFFCSRE